MSVHLSRLLSNDATLLRGATDVAISGLTADSRDVKPGYLFAALPGTRVDGARFIPQAVAAGAVAIIAGEAASDPGGGAFIRSVNPRKLFAQMAARFAGAQPDIVVAVTGTNGKTSVASFVRQIWEAMGFRAASIGTVGIAGPRGEEYLEHTTPDPVKLHTTLAKLAADHVTHLSLEASSHGLAQYRLDGVRLSAGAFTNITRDHLDYHETFDDYFVSKARLFGELIPPGAAAVINADVPQAGEVGEIARSRGLRLFTVGHRGAGLKIIKSRRDGFGQHLMVAGPKSQYEFILPLVGDFQASNALIAAGLVIATGGEEELAMHALESLKGAKGRLDLVAKSASGAPIFVDYAHTPDALENAVTALRPYVGNKLRVVFGAGGDRDKGKRPEMGAVVAKLADVAYVTDDNPRGEDPAEIRTQVLAGCPGGIDAGDRASAIRAAVAALVEGDILLVAGKGHEIGQTIGGKTFPFSDHDAVRAAVREKLTVADRALWTVEDVVSATAGELHGFVQNPINGVTIDSRTVGLGDIFVAIKGDRLDGHDFAAAALKAGAGIAIVSRVTDEMKAAGPVLVVSDPLSALDALGRQARGRSFAQIVGITGSVGKTSTKEALWLAFSASGKTHVSSASLNNQWGVPLSLARMPQDSAYAGFEIGMNHAGEITPLVKMVRPHIAVITAIAPSHLGHFASMAEIADAKAEIFLGVEPGGAAVINRDTLFFERLASAARSAGITRVLGFGQHQDADVRLDRLALHAECSCITATIAGETVMYKLGVPGEHMAVNSLAVLAAVKLAGADLARASLALSAARPAKGRGVRTRLRTADGTLTLIDESYNANPVSVRAALKLLAQTQPGKRGRRVAVLGDMLELGKDAPAFHAGLADAVHESHVDILYASGPLMAHLWEKIPPRRRGVYAETPEKLTEPLLDAVGPGDVVMVKGSLGSRMGPVVEAMRARFSPADKDG